MYQVPNAAEGYETLGPLNRQWSTVVVIVIITNVLISTFELLSILGIMDVLLVNLDSYRIAMEV